VRLDALGCWHSSFGVLLDRCCLCRVQVGVDDRGRFIEFDGFPHKCKRPTPPVRVVASSQAGVASV
jgi:hypothetical protein